MHAAAVVDVHAVVGQEYEANHEDGVRFLLEKLSPFIVIEYLTRQRCNACGSRYPFANSDPYRLTEWTPPPANV